MDKQAWNAAAAASEFLSPILNWGVDPRPPGDFVSYLGNPSSYPLPQQPLNQQAMLQHLHYSGGPSYYVPCPAPQPSPSIRKPRTPVKPSGSQQTISVDNAEDGDKRTEKRLAWTSQEDVRLKECNGKGKSKEVAADMELLEKLVATHEEAKKTRRDMIEMQQRSSSEKVEVARLSAETARLSALAAKDNIEAKKQEKEAEMMRAYRALLVQDIIGMTDEMKNELVKTLKVMRERLFGT
ncbi:hypothetical protein D1007_26226 [Hordeum vulgare]|nr:hypothetical protein D1007_26226 [Hordeum vulgare]